MPTYRVTFHFGSDGTQDVQLYTDPQDSESLEEYLARKLDAEKFTTFGDGAGGFVLIAVGRVTKVDVRLVD